jgi:hypothetical protein
MRLRHLGPEATATVRSNFFPIFSSFTLYAVSLKSPNAIISTFHTDG